jgi:dipeptidyl aminopeptidase/acylaminoacyl peptidase
MRQPVPQTVLPEPVVAVTRATTDTPQPVESVQEVTEEAPVLDTETPEPTASPTVSSTPEPYAGLSISSLASRTYGGGEIRVESILAVNSYFTRTLISYPSDGLRIFGFMNVPARAEPPYPVVVASHGYIDPNIYETIDYTTRYADALARNGYLVLHPNLRGYPPSDNGDNLFRVGMAIDVLNLIAIVRETGGEPGPLVDANKDAIGVWGHSMGGGVSTRVITVDPGIKAAVLYGAMSGDERENFERIFNYFSNGERGIEELAYPDDAYEVISPINYLERIQAAVSIHHGSNDGEVPLAWSQDLCNKLNELGKQVECFTYHGMPHTFYGESDDLFMQRMVDFYNRTLR